jgi:CRISPR-associated protein Csm3
MKIIKLTGIVELESGLHIGGGDDTMKIGGIDNQVIKDINTNEPYIPGSSLKGKMRSLLEWHIGVVNLNRQYKIGDIEKNKDENGKPLNSAHIWKKSKKGEFLKDEFIDVAFQDGKLFKKVSTLLKLFGDKEGEFGITRISIGDCKLIENGLKTSEAKYENVIDRQKGTAQHPRQIERVPAGVKFEFDIRVKILDGDSEQEFKEMVEKGLELIESDYLGGSGSRGYGRVKFINRKWE